MGDGAVAGHHRAAYEGGAVKRHVAPDGDAGVLVHQHLLGKGRQAQHLLHGRAGRADARFFVGAAFGLGADAARQMAGDAMLAVAAKHRQASDHVITWLDGAHLGADLLDDARRLVAQDAGQRRRVDAVDEVQV